jgi:hypothetical protein
MRRRRLRILRLEYLYYGLNNVTLTGPISPGSFLPVTFTWPNYGGSRWPQLQVPNLASRVKNRQTLSHGEICL